MANPPSPQKKSPCAGLCLFDRLVTVSRHLPWRPGCPFTHGFSTLWRGNSLVPGGQVKSYPCHFWSTYYSKTIPGIQGLHTPQKLSVASRVYILLKNYPWHPRSTYYSKTIPGIRGLHTTQKLSLASRVYILLKNYPWHPGST